MQLSSKQKQKNVERATDLMEHISSINTILGEASKQHPLMCLGSYFPKKKITQDDVLSNLIFALYFNTTIKCPPFKTAITALRICLGTVLGYMV